MSALEDRLRDAYRAATQTVQPGAIPARPGPASAPRRPGQARTRRTRLLVPITAAAAVAALIVTVTLLTAGHSGPAAQGPTMPRYYVAAEEGGLLTVHSTATGAVTGTIRLPQGMTLTGQVAAAGRRTFVAALTISGTDAFGQNALCSTELYEFRLSQSGRPAPPSRLIGTVPGLLSGADDLATSAGGNMIAYASSSARCPGAPAGEAVGIINMTTGQNKSWPVPAAEAVGSVALSADGQVLAFTQLPATDRQPAGVPAGSEVRWIATGAPAGPADRYSQLMGPLGDVVALSADGQSVLLCRRSPHAHPVSTVTYTVKSLSLSTGNGHVIGPLPAEPAPLCQAALDPSGRYLLISLPDRGSPELGQLAVADLRTGQTSTLPPRGGAAGGPARAVGFAW